MKTEEKLITPKWAADRLEELRKAQEDGTFKQRPPRPRAIQRYAADMAAGKWLVTHQGIAFDTNNNLLDGQNRLWAVVEADVPVKMMVTTEVAGNGKLTAMDVIDGGMPRCLATHLQLSHQFGTEAHEASSLVKCIVNIVLGSTAAIGHKGKGSPQISTQEALFILDDLGFKADLERFRAVATLKKVRNRVLAGTWCWYHKAQPNKADFFLNDYVTLENLPAKAPALLLTRFFQSMGKKARRNETQLIRVTSNALYAFDKGVKLTDLRESKEAHEWLVGLLPKKADAIVKRISP